MSPYGVSTEEYRTAHDAQEVDAVLQRAEIPGIGRWLTLPDRVTVTRVLTERGLSARSIAQVFDCSTRSIPRYRAMG